jgi:hypothetical protein
MMNVEIINLFTNKNLICFIPSFVTLYKVVAYKKLKGNEYHFNKGRRSLNFSENKASSTKGNNKRKYQ